jgi:DNA-binding SARP family transcriptional activator
MIGFRPKTSELYLERPRLLNLLPDSEGYVVWLEAPYGYGKSVLTSQWARQLESQWRVLWLASGGWDVKNALEKLLELPPETPWGMLLEELWKDATLLVVEDLEGHEDLNPLLKDVRGLLLIASRTTLPYQELPRLKTQKRLVHLQAKQLAFTPDEAKPLFNDEQSATQAWERSQGWSLPLHFSALTGEAPEAEALLEGIQESLSEEAWNEALFLAVLPFLPVASENDASQELVKSGFVQQLEAGLRLHQMTAEAIVGEYFEACKSIVQENLHRLPPHAQAEACERLGLTQELAHLLEIHQFSHEDPESLLRWDALIGGERGVQRSTGVGWSLWTLGREDEALRILFETAARPNLSPDERLSIYKNMVWVLAQKHAFDEARKVEALAEPYLEQASPEQAGRFLNNLFLLYFELGDWPHCESVLQRALQAYPPASPYRAIATGNLAITGWHHRGDVDGLLLERGKMLATNRKINPNNVPGDMLQLAELQTFLGQTEKALDILSDIGSYYKTNPRWTLEAQALQAYLEHTPENFPNLLYQAKLWERSLQQRIQFFWARTLRKVSAQKALKILENTDHPWANIEKALAMNSLQDKKALETLGKPPEKNQIMELRLYYHAARFEITRDPNDLQTFLDLTLASERLLPGCIALKNLPKDKPELSRVYELREVLVSSWQEAIAYRHHEIPNLEIHLLGQLQVSMLGNPVDLTDRQKAMLALLLLDYDRNVIGEALWPDVDTKKVLNNLNVQLTLLRKTLEPWGLKTYLTEDGLSRSNTDIRRLREALGQNNVTAVLQLYREPLAPDVDLPLLDEARESLREEVIDCFFEAAQSGETRGGETQSGDDGVAYLERLLELDPLHEEALRLLLEKLVVRGRKREAVKRYQSFAAKLKTEMDLEPLEVTQKILGEASV